MPAETTEREEQHLPVVEDAAKARVVLQFRYLTVTRGKETVRHASVHRVLVDPPARFVATCHRSGTLKWFRIESVSDTKLDAREPFREVDTKLVNAYVRASLDGFHDGGPPVTQAFFVSDPDARWVARNLMYGMECEDVPGGIRVSDERERIVGAAESAIEARYPEAVTAHQARAGALAARATQVRLHLRRPLGGVNDQRAHGLGPQHRVLGCDDGCHARGLCRRRARRRQRWPSRWARAA